MSCRESLPYRLNSSNRWQITDLISDNLLSRQEDEGLLVNLPGGLVLIWITWIKFRERLHIPLHTVFADQYND
jgi:hypothetical protein